MKNTLHWLMIGTSLYIFIADRFVPGYLKMDLSWGSRFSPLISKVKPSCIKVADKVDDKKDMRGPINLININDDGKVVKATDKKDVSNTPNLLTLLGIPECKDTTTDTKVRTYIVESEGYKVNIQVDEKGRVIKFDKEK